MRTKWLASAALAALVVSACSLDNINGPITIRLPPPGTVVGSVTDTTSGGSCIVRYDLIASGSRTIPVGGEVTLTVFPVPNRTDCAVEDDFQGEADRGTSVVRVVGVNPVTVRVTGVAAGTDNVCMVSIPGRRVSVCTVITVTGTTTSSLTISPVGNIFLFPTACPSAGATTAVLTASMSVNWLSSNPNVASVNPASGTSTTVTGLAAGTVTITATGPQGEVATRTVTVNACPGASTIVISPSGITATNCTGFQTSWPLAVTVNGVASSGTWYTGNSNIASINSSTGAVTLTGTAGTTSVWVQTASGQSPPIAVTVNQCQPGARVDSVTLTPATWNLIVGGPDVVLTATVWGTAGISQAVTFGNSQPGCATVTQNGNQITVHALLACANVVISATSVADVTKTDTSAGSISSGTVSCEIRNTAGVKLDSTTVVIPAGTNSLSVVVICTNQFGTQFRPWGEANTGTSNVTIVGSSNINIGGVNWPAGPNFTITRVSAGTARITFHAAVTDVTVLEWFDITFP